MRAQVLFIGTGAVLGLGLTFLPVPERLTWVTAIGYDIVGITVLIGFGIFFWTSLKSQVVVVDPRWSTIDAHERNARILFVVFGGTVVFAGVVLAEVPKTDLGMMSWLRVLAGVLLPTSVPGLIFSLPYRRRRIWAFWGVFLPLVILTILWVTAAAFMTFWQAHDNPVAAGKVLVCALLLAGAPLWFVRDLWRRRHHDG